MNLRNAKLCPNCEELFTDDRCPRCGDRFFVWLTNYLTPIVSREMLESAGFLGGEAVAG